MRRPIFLTPGAGFGIALGLVSIISIAVCATLFWKVLQVENRAFIQQSIGDTSRALAIHYKDKFDRLALQLVAFGEGLLQSPHKPQKASTKVSLGTLDSDSEILDAALWRRVAQNSVFTELPEANRVFVAINAKNDEVGETLMDELDKNLENEKALVLAAFQGHVVISLSSVRSGKRNTFLIAVPLGHGGVIEEAVVSHIELDRFQKGLVKDGMVSTVLLDDAGNVLAHPDLSQVGKRLAYAQNPLFQAMHKAGAPSGQLDYVDEQMHRFFGGFAKVGIGQLAVLASLPEKEATTPLATLVKQTLIFSIAFFLLFLGLGYLYSTSTLNSLDEQHEAESSGDSAKGVQEVLVDNTAMAQKTVATVLYGSLRDVDQVSDHTSIKGTSELINGFFRISSEVIEEYGGTFERTSSSAYLAVWGVPASDGTEVWKSLRAALEVRKRLCAFNDKRQAMQDSVLSYGLGVHSGRILAAPLTAPIVGSTEVKFTVIGDAVNGAKALSQLTISAKRDLLISKDVWQATDGMFIGEPLGEAKLPQHVVPTLLYVISGYREGEGQVVTVHPPEDNRDHHTSGEAIASEWVSEKKPASLWSVDNGSKLKGPYEATKIAALLFSQELDFDCLAKAQGEEKTVPIRDAGIFIGSADPLADLWVYDGKTVSGPMTFGFLKTALGQGAVSVETAWVCEKTTVSGWKKLSDQLSMLQEAAKPPLSEFRSAENSPASDSISIHSTHEEEKEPNLKVAIHSENTTDEEQASNSFLPTLEDKP